MPRNPEITFVVKLGSKSIGTPEGEPRKDLIEHNAAELAEVRESGLVVMLSSGAELFGRRIVLTPRHRKYLSERKEQIRCKYANDKEMLDRRIKEVNEATTRDIHREGQIRLMQIWGHAFARHGIHLIPELLDGEKRDLSEDIKSAHDRDAIVVFNGHGSLEPEGKAADNDQNLPGVVEWVAPHVDEDEDPDDPRTRLFVLGVTDPATRGLLNRDGKTIDVYYGTSLDEHIDPERAISKGGPISKALAFFAIKGLHPQSQVGISGNREGVIYDFRNGRADTTIEFKKDKGLYVPDTIAS